MWCNRVVQLALALGLITLVSRASGAAGINLSWDDCGTSGVPLETFACSTNTGEPFVLVASFDPPAGVTSLIGVSGEIRIAATQLPDWWRHGAGQCRGPSALNASFDFTASSSCADPWKGKAVGSTSYQVDYYGPSTARLRVSGFLPDIRATPVTAGTEYYAFKVLIGRTQTTACSGCDRAVSLTLEELRLYQLKSAGFDPILRTALDEVETQWQAPVAPAPLITSFTPGSGTPGDTVGILGSSFTNTRTVSFLGAAASFVVVSDTEIRTVVPMDARPGKIRVTTPNGSALSAADFQLVPRLRSFLPRQAPVGEWVAITGAGLSAVGNAFFNGAAALRLEFRTDTLIQARIPFDATTGPIVITGPLGFRDTSDTSFVVGPWLEGGLSLAWDDCRGTGSSLKAFACDDNTSEFPMVASFVPPPDVVQLDGFEAVIRLSGNTIPDWWQFAYYNCRAGALVPDFDFRGGPFTCTDLWKGSRSGGYSYELGYYGPSTARLRIQAFGPEIPASPDTQYYAFRVKVDSRRTVGSSTCGGCTLPVSFTLEQIALFQDRDLWFNPPAITTPLRRSTIYWQAVPGPLPIVRGFIPTYGGAGTPVRISGQYFEAVTGVQFGNTAASFAVESDSVINAVVPVDARSGPIRVTTIQGGGQSAASFTAPPIVTSLSPARARIGESIAILGYNFSGTQRVEFNGIPAEFRVFSETRLGAEVPEGTTDGPVVVFNPAGSDTSPTSFVVAPPPVDGINLSWDDCGASGTSFKSWACDSNTGNPHVMIASFKAPHDIVAFLGVSIRMDFLSSAATLPEWWKHGSGYCRGTTGLASDFDFTSGPYGCADPWLGRGAGGHLFQVGGLPGLTGPNRASLLVQAALPQGSEEPLSPGTEYFACKIRWNRSKTTGTGSCSGCLTAGCFTLNEIQVFQPLEYNHDPKVTTPDHGTTVFWQGTIPGCNIATPVQISLVISEAHPDHNRIVWEVPRGEAATVYRREGEGDWRRLERLMPDGEQRIEYLDGDVRPGITYRYRLGFVIQGEEIFGGETALTVPAARTLSLSRISWSGTGVTALVSLAGNEPAALEIFDLGGRRTASKRIEGKGEGEQRVEVATRLSPGVYFGRLTQDRSSVSGRFVVVQ